MADSTPKNSRSKGLDLKRIATALSIALGILGIAMADYSMDSKIGFYLIWGSLVALSLYELFDMARARGFHPFAMAGTYAGVMLALDQGGQYWLAGLPVALCLDLWLHVKRKAGPIAARSLLLTLAGAGCLGLLGSYMTKIRLLPPGEHPWKALLLLLLVIAISKCGDSAAYFVGRKFGRRKLAPAISPNKTWEGALGSLAASLAVAAASSALLRTGIFLPMGPALLFGALVGVASQLGDLAESWYKRKMGATDSGGLLPHYGGILDLIDALFFAAPAAYFLLLLLHEPFAR